jgi:DNA-directed RNA polymerase specialized sigma24 family protein
MGVGRNDERFAALWSQERDRLVRLAFLICGDRCAAQDLVADAVAKVLVRWRSRRVENLAAYLIVRSSTRHSDSAVDEPWRSVVLRFYEDLSELRTAEMLEISLGTVKSRTARGLERLRELLPSLEGHDHARP